MTKAKSLTVGLHPVGPQYYGCNNLRERQPTQDNGKVAAVAAEAVVFEAHVHVARRVYIFLLHAGCT